MPSTFKQATTNAWQPGSAGGPLCPAMRFTQRFSMAATSSCRGRSWTGGIPLRVNWWLEKLTRVERSTGNVVTHLCAAQAFDVIWHNG